MVTWDVIRGICILLLIWIFLPPFILVFPVLFILLIHTVDFVHRNRIIVATREFVHLYCGGNLNDLSLISLVHPDIAVRC
ncbi:hypothetical protein BRC91_00980, partial [Halobacteriales archaeon QS_4_62_28]